MVRLNKSIHLLKSWPMKRLKSRDEVHDARVVALGVNLTL